MKKLFVIACIILGGCVMLGCNNGTAKIETQENDSVIVAQHDSILEVLDNDSALADSLICND